MSLRSGMWAVCFTDMVGSTEQRARLGDAAGDALRREHDQIVARAAATYDGVVVKGTGDGAMVAFSSAAGAIAAAVEIQQRIERYDRTASEPLRLRVGISLGEVVYEAGDLHGLAANEAARVCALANAGEILVTDLARAVAASRATETLIEHGEHQFKGLPNPVKVWKVDWAPGNEPESMPLPSLLPADAMAFAGRRVELEALTAAWDEARAGSRRLLLVSGEPGIGKTRLAAEIASKAHGSGALVLYGRCDDEIGIPFQPFTEALDWYLERADDIVIGEFPGDLARLSRRVELRLPGVAPRLETDPDSEQHRLFDAVSSWLSALARVQPVVFVLDDIHWATKPTLLMLRAAARNVDAPVLLIATYRDTDLDRAHPLGSMLGDFRKLDAVARVALSGLAESDVIDLLERISNQSADPSITALAQALVRETEGNPFFIGEVLRHLVDTETLVHRDGRWTSDVDVSEIGIPEGIKQVLGQRLDALGEATAVVLRAAAVVGRQFTIPELAAAANATEDGVLDAVEPAIRARLIEETAPDRCQFTHALVRSALVDELAAGRRLRIHRRVAEHLEIVGGEPSAVAYHWLEAASSADPNRTVAAVLAAAERAVATGAYDDAVQLLTRGLAFADETELESAQERELTLRLGEAQRLTGDPKSWDTLVEAYTRAVNAGDTNRLVRATLAMSRGFARNFSATDQTHIERLYKALEALGPDPSRERALLLTSLAAELQLHLDDRRVRYLQEASDIAHQIGDLEVLAWVLTTRAMAVSPLPAEQEAWAVELEAIADQLDPARRLRARGALHQLQSHLGRFELARAELDRIREGLIATPTAISRWVLINYDTKMASLDGRLAIADQLNQEQLAFGIEQGFPDAAIFWVAHDIGLTLDLGRVDERIHLYQTNLVAQPDASEDTALTPMTRAIFAALHAEVGNHVEANECLEIELRAQFALITARTNIGTAYVNALAHAAAILHHRDAARRLYDILLPYAGRTTGANITCDGFADRALGRLATVLGNYDAAGAHLEAATHLHAANEFPLLLARTWADTAELLAQRDAAGDADRAQQLVDDAVTNARNHDALGVEQYAQRVLTKA
jgi:class 3 adenylate cyclase/tetratricopeptide (TPR) repeat protein